MAVRYGLNVFFEAAVGADYCTSGIDQAIDVQQYPLLCGGASTRSGLQRTDAHAAVGLEGHDRQLVACGEGVDILVVAEADEKLVYCFSVGDGEAVM